MTTDSIPQRTCKSCNITYPLIAEFWHKDPKSAYGLCYTCKECAKARSRQWHSEHPDRVKENKQRYYQDNLDKIQEYRAENAQSIAEVKRQWRKDNPDKVKIHKTNDRRRNKAGHARRQKRWRKRHPNQDRAIVHRRVARKHNAEGSYTADDIAHIYENQMGRCLYCGITLHDDYHVDHIIPLSRQGTNWPDNLAVACPECNMSKNNHLLDEWEAIRGW